MTACYRININIKFIWINKIIRLKCHVMSWLTQCWCLWWWNFNALHNLEWHKTRIHFNTDFFFFCIFFSMLLSFTFKQSEGVYFHTSSNCKLFYFANLRAKTRMHTALTKEIEQLLPNQTWSPTTDYTVQPSLLVNY